MPTQYAPSLGVGGWNGTCREELYATFLNETYRVSIIAHTQRTRHLVSACVRDRALVSLSRRFSDTIHLYIVVALGRQSHKFFFEAPRGQLYKSSFALFQRHNKDSGVSLARALWSPVVDTPIQPSPVPSKQENSDSRGPRAVS